LPNTSIYIVDEQLNLVPAGVKGEICIGGVGVARGYHNQPELTAQRFVPDPFVSQVGERIYRTGDLGRWRPDGTLDFVGRSDIQVKIRGYRVELSEIETCLRTHPAVATGIVISRETGHKGPELVAYFIGIKQMEPTSPTGPEELWKFMAQRLSGPV
jgi:acyl-coenzyme A synthetase/AMP-(fatty) acid ligase